MKTPKIVELAGKTDPPDRKADQMSNATIFGTWQREALAFAEAGMRVGVFADTRTIARGQLPDFEAILDKDTVQRIIRVNGETCIDFHSGGRIYFYSTRSIPRRVSLDRLYVPASVDHESMEQLAPLVITSKEPAIVGYF